MSTAEVEDNYNLRFEGPDIPANQVRRVVIELRNDGKVDVEPSSYVRPISFSFEESARIVAANVIDQDPRSIQASFRERSEENQNRATLDHNLLNGGDSVLLQIFLTGSNHTDIEVDGRIVGVKDIVDRHARERTRSKQVKKLGLVMVSVLVVLAPITIDVFLLEDSPEPATSASKNVGPESSRPDLPGLRPILGQSSPIPLFAPVPALTPLFAAVVGVLAGTVVSGIGVIVTRLLRRRHEARLKSVT